MTQDMLANIVGLLGSALVVGAYGYSNVARAMDFRLFNGLNLAGALLLIASLTVHFNLAAMTLEVVWAIIAALGLARAMRRRA
ncbi:CBU_0592 family membrane protein [Sphingobium lignivorans]|uniref:CBU-0592-like domain-containing protein n=1 Tax=Sphingobium lignivorans TaxID=2735886 RepID=A0ABR6NEM1_9SPHN|nr:hypothetical protein [Sphingobium lignivorans]MBB5985727.1 hypothetical protein [Sphingobium lignivorans]